MVAPPVPYSIDDSPGDYVVIMAGKRFVAQEVRRKDAEGICRAVNYHAALVEFVRQMARLLGPISQTATEALDLLAKIDAQEKETK